MRVRTNLLFLGLWGVAAALLLVAADPKPVVSIAIGAIFGTLVGWRQARSLRDSADEFRAVDSALGVRRVMMSTPGGRAAVASQWIGALAIVCASRWIDGSSVPGTLGSVAILFFARDALALPGVLAAHRGKTTQSEPDGR